MKQLFYATRIENGFVYLDEEESRHLTTVLRKKTGDLLSLTDGKGFFYEAEISETGKRHVIANIISQTEQSRKRTAKLHIAIAPTKHIERIEWFLEKATEIGIDEITPLLCHRSERDTIRHDRLQKVLISAMKQCLRADLPKLNELTRFKNLVAAASEPQKRIAWCADFPLPGISEGITGATRDTLVLIGPEGDFTEEEVAFAQSCGFEGLSLGAARLRTETAGLLVVAAFNI